MTAKKPADPLKVGDRVKLSDSFIAPAHPERRARLAKMRGHISEILNEGLKYPTAKVMWVDATPFAGQIAYDALHTITCLERTES